MKRFFAFLLPWALFVLNLPELVEKLGKWIPIFSSAGNKLTSSVNALIASLPPAPGCGNCIAFYWFWPTIVSMLLIVAAYGLFYVVYIRLFPQSSSNFLNAKPNSILFLFFASQLLVIYLVQTWLLWKYSGITLLKSLSIISFNGRVAAAHDKNFFLHASNVYGFLIIGSYLTLALLTRYAWQTYKRNPEAKPPSLG